MFSIILWLLLPPLSSSPPQLQRWKAGTPALPAPYFQFHHCLLWINLSGVTCYKQARTSKGKVSKLCHFSPQKLRWKWVGSPPTQPFFSKCGLRGRRVELPLKGRTSYCLLLSIFEHQPLCILPPKPKAKSDLMNLALRPNV